MLYLLIKGTIPRFVDTGVSGLSLSLRQAIGLVMKVRGQECLQPSLSFGFRTLVELLDSP